MTYKKIAVYGKANDEKKDNFIKKINTLSNKFTYVNSSPLDRFRSFNHPPKLKGIVAQLFLIDDSWKIPCSSSPLTLESFTQIDRRYKNDMGTYIIFYGQSLKCDQQFEKLSNLKNVKLLVTKTLETKILNVIEEELMDLIYCSKSSKRDRSTLPKS